ncbi:hypothetical protein [Paraburkholderia terrae]|jgi:hypothetical protein|uniref:hypothetical protein n=1 Tax=Paraburkholderia terrae TaxID=311230 RepID=UPI001EE29A27|nr:hypothetical protein [Paraburkholderia terrae]GJH03325.1 hypothetical protein CBA19C8_22230 [Paraburkholderia terrae]
MIRKTRQRTPVLTSACTAAFTVRIYVSSVRLIQAFGFHVCDRDRFRPGALHAPTQYMMPNYELQALQFIDFAVFYFL